MSASTKRPWARNTRDLQTKRKIYRVPFLPNSESFHLSLKKKVRRVTKSSFLCRARAAVQAHFFLLPPFVCYTLERFVALRPTCNHSLNIHPNLSFHFQGSQRREKKIITDLCSLQKRHYSRPILKLENSLSSQYVEAWDRDPPLTTR